MFWFGVGVAVTTVAMVDLTGGDFVSPAQESPEIGLTTTTLLANNLAVTLFLLSGAFLFGMTTLAGLFMNGFVGGLALLSMEGTTPATMLLLVLPHAVFELPGYWLAGAAGLKIPHMLVQYLLNQSDRVVDPDGVTDAIILAAASIVLVVVGAIVESQVTTVFVNGSPLLLSS